MIGLASRGIAILAFGLMMASTALAQSEDLIPARRLTLSQNTDLPGGFILDLRHKSERL